MIHFTNYIVPSYSSLILFYLQNSKFNLFFFCATVQCILLDIVNGFSNTIPLRVLYHYQVSLVFVRHTEFVEAYIPDIYSN